MKHQRHKLTSEQRRKYQAAIRYCIQPHTPNAVELRRASIIARGVLTPVVVWAQTQLKADGILNAEIADKEGVPYETIEVEFADLPAAMAWRTARHNGRHRNDWVRCREAIENLRGWYSKQAKKRQRLSRGRGRKGAKKGLPEMAYLFRETKNTRQFLASVADVSAGLMGKAIRIWDYGPKCLANWADTLERLEAGAATIGSIESNVIRAQTEADRAKHRRKRQKSKESRQPRCGPGTKRKAKKRAWRNHIVVGDALAVLRDVIPKDVITLIATSPPYPGVELDYEGVHDPSVPYKEQLAYLSDVWAECARVLRPGGRLCINLDNIRNKKADAGYDAYRYNFAADTELAMREVRLAYNGYIVWNKQNWSGRATAWGDPENPELRPNCELIVIYSKGDTRQRKQLGRYGSDLTGKERAQWTLNFWDITPDTQTHSKHHHPCAFPAELPRRLIKMWSFKGDEDYPGDIVLDPFCGSGTTCAVAASLFRRFVGIDGNRQYVEYARQRTRKATKAGEVE